jgi:demethylmenaquinone methyltransferase/2-methoxy-6-polyprenyl-1,4-benzoquinol methylase
MTNVDKSNEKVRRMFAQIAPRYDLLNQVLSLNIDRQWRRYLVRQLNLTGDSPVLDVCTGTGELAVEIARSYPRRFPIIGTDFCGPMLELARHKPGRLGLSGDKVRFLEADTQHLPFEDNTFQAVSVAFGIRNVADTVGGLREMIRVCQPRGQVAILEFSKPSWPVLKQLYDVYFRYLLPAIGQAMARNSESAYHYLPASVQQFPSGKAMEQLMAQCGLRGVRSWPLTLGIATLYIGSK